MNRSTWRLALLFTSLLCTSAFWSANGYADKSYYEYQETPVANPGDSPVAPAAGRAFRLIVGGLFLSLGIAGVGIVAMSRKWRREKLAALLLVAVASALFVILWVSRTSQNPEYRKWKSNYSKWQQKQDAYQRGDTVKKKVRVNDSRNDDERGREL